VASARSAPAAEPMVRQIVCTKTYNRGQPPAVKIEGQGLDARVRVGRQTVSFDGEKIRLGR